MSPFLLRITLRDLLVDTLLLAICAGGLSYMPARAAGFAAILFGGLVIVIVIGRLCDMMGAARIGTVLGALVGPALLVPAAFATRGPNLGALISLLPLSVLGGALVTSLFFVLIHWIQHLGQDR